MQGDDPVSSPTNLLMLQTILALVCVSSQSDIAPLHLVEPLRDKNFYFCSRLQAHPNLVKLIQADRLLSETRQRRGKTFSDVEATLGLGNSKGVDQLIWSPSEIQETSQELSKLTSEHLELSQFVQSELRRTHVYQRFENLSDPELMAKAWQICAEGINQIIEVYGSQTKGGHSPEINGPIYKIKDPLYGGLLHTVLSAIQEEQEKTFFDWSTSLAVELLRAQVRDEAGRYEPLEFHENSKALAQVKKTDWRKYRYSSILVPGYGPEEAQVRFSPIGRIACELAAKRWRAGLAPFILTSGGHAHPDRTPYCEALEMKRCLMNDFGVPESAILVDPHARHTTTNIRNAVRILARGGVPMQIPVLIVTNPYQAQDIVSPSFAKRCEDIFGYIPYTNVKRIAKFDVSFLPDLKSLTIDPQDPLDP